MDVPPPRLRLPVNVEQLPGGLLPPFRRPHGEHGRAEDTRPGSVFHPPTELVWRQVSLFFSFL